MKGYCHHQNHAPNETLYNFTVAVTFDHASLVSAGKSEADGDDIRFLSSDNNTEYVFGIEDNASASWGMNTATTTAWVMIKEWSASSNLVMHMYYGNGGALNGQVAIDNAWDADTVWVLTFSNSSGTNVFDAKQDILGTLLLS